MVFTGFNTLKHSEMYNSNRFNKLLTHNFADKNGSYCSNFDSNSKFLCHNVFLLTGARSKVSLVLFQLIQFFIETYK